MGTWCLREELAMSASAWDGRQRRGVSELLCAWTAREGERIPVVLHAFGSNMVLMYTLV